MSSESPHLSPRTAWRDAAWTAHEGEGLDLDATADAAVRVVLEHLLARAYLVYEADQEFPTGKVIDSFHVRNLLVDLERPEVSE